MRRLIDPEIMRSCEAAYFRSSGVASIDVMEVAARALADAALERFPDARRVFIACGPGGNGGDGYACARMLREAGLDVHIYPAAPAKSADAIANAERVRDLIRNTNVDGNRTPCGAEAQSANIATTQAQVCQETTADSPAGNGIRIPNNMPAVRELIRDTEVDGNRTHCGAEAQSANIATTQAQACQETTADSPAGNGIRIPNNMPANIHPSDTDAKSIEAGMSRTQARKEASAYAEATQMQARERFSADSAASDCLQIPNDTPAKIHPSDTDAKSIEAGMSRTQARKESSAYAEATQMQARERFSADSAASDCLQIPNDTPAKIQPSAAKARPVKAGISQDARKESSTDAETAKSQTCDQSPANPAANAGIRIANVALTKLHPAAAEVQTVEAEMSWTHAHEESPSDSSVGNGIPILDVIPPKSQCSAPDAQPAEAGISLAQTCDQSSANPAMNGDIRIPNAAPTKLPPSDTDAQPADSSANRAQFHEKSSADSSAGNEIPIPDAAPTKPQCPVADAQPAEAGISLAQTFDQSSANPAMNGDIRIPYAAPTKLLPSDTDAQPADSSANRAQFREKSSADSSAGNDIRIPDVAPSQAQFREESPADSTAGNEIQIPDVAPTKVPLSSKEAHSANAGVGQPKQKNSVVTAVAAHFANAGADQPHASSEACAGGGLSAHCGPGEVSEIPDLWIDCLYGTGLSRAPSGAAAELILRMNRDRAAGAKVLAADIPSGLNGATGARFEPCVEADCTVAFQFAKPGHLLGDGLDVCGELRVADVGFPETAFPANLPVQLEPSDLRGMFAPRRRNIHKGSCGHLLIVAGSFGMAGAAALCARAALRSGVGLVSVACPASVVPILQGLAPCAMCVPLPERDGAISPEAVEPLRAALWGKSAAVIGPGLSRKAAPEIVAAVLESGLPAVIDADALNLLAENPALKSLLRPHHILTPHPGEAARLLGHPCANPIADARKLAGMGAQAKSQEEHPARRPCRGQAAGAPEGAADRAAIPAGAQSDAFSQRARIASCAGVKTIDERSANRSGEAARLLGHPCANPIANARELAGMGAQAKSQEEHPAHRPCRGQAAGAPEGIADRAAIPAGAQSDAFSQRARIASCAGVKTIDERSTNRSGEAARLLGHPCANPIADARKLAGMGAQGEMADERSTDRASVETEAANNGDKASSRAQAASADKCAKIATSADIPDVLPPHPGEAARLPNRTCADPIVDARELAALGEGDTQTEAADEGAEGQSCAENEAAGNQVEGTPREQAVSADKCAKTATSADARKLAALGQGDTQTETADEGAEGQSCAKNEAAGNQAEGTAREQAVLAGGCVEIATSADIPDVLPPHLGEAARMPNRTCADPIADARELAALGAQEESQVGHPARRPCRDLAMEGTKEGAAGHAAIPSGAQSDAFARSAAIAASMRMEAIGERSANLPGEATCNQEEITANRRADIIADASALVKAAGECATEQLCVQNEAAGNRTEGAASRRCANPIADAPSIAARGIACAHPEAADSTSSAQAEAAGECAARQLRAQSEAASYDCAHFITDMYSIAALGTVGAQPEAADGAANAQPEVTDSATSAQPEAMDSAASAPAESVGKRAAKQSCVPHETVGNRAEGAASCCYTAPTADAQPIAAPGSASTPVDAASGCAKTLACMQEKSAGVLNRREEISANAQAEALGEHVPILASALGDARDDGGGTLARERKNLAGALGDALGPDRKILAGERNNLADALGDALGAGGGMIAGEWKNLASAQDDALGGCAKILANARKNPTDAREETRTGARAPFGPTAVLKGASRVIAGGGEIYVSVSGCPGMARGGSGDVYAGILGALLAEKSGRTPAQSAAAACELHGLAGELAQAKYGPRSMNSADLIEFLPEVFQRYVD